MEINKLVSGMSCQIESEWPTTDLYLNPDVRDNRRWGTDLFKLLDGKNIIDATDSIAEDPWSVDDYWTNLPKYMAVFYMGALMLYELRDFIQPRTHWLNKNQPEFCGLIAMQFFILPGIQSSIVYSPDIFKITRIAGIFLDFKVLRQSIQPSVFETDLTSYLKGRTRIERLIEGTV
jgi:hypothetical protein